MKRQFEEIVYGLVLKVEVIILVVGVCGLVLVDDLEAIVLAG